MLSRVPRPSRRRALVLSAVPLAGLFAAALLAPLPFAVAQPGTTADVVGRYRGEPVITVSGAPTRRTEGRLLMTTIVATGPDARTDLGDVLGNWFRTDRAVMPRDSVYPSGQSTEQIERHNLDDMAESQDAATAAALRYLGRGSEGIDVDLRLADVGGPSAGLLFALGIVDKLDGDGAGGDLTGGRTVAGTGTIEADGDVGAVGGVELKTQAARRDGASVFLVPEDECGQAGARRPAGLRLVPVTDLKGAVAALRALARGREVPSC